MVLVLEAVVVELIQAPHLVVVVMVLVVLLSLHILPKYIKQLNNYKRWLILHN